MKFNKAILPNGLRVVTIPMPDNPSVTVLVMVEAGSKYETKEINGLSHFLEHMVFKGTPRRPKASDISRELDSLGAQYNAFTSQEYTGYYAKTDSRHLDTILDIVSDMYLNPLFDQNEIKKEAGVIIEEIRMYNDLPQSRVHNLLSKIMHGDQPAGWMITGSEENVRSFTPDHFIKYRNEQYVGKATTIIISGSFAEDTIVNKVAQAFSPILNTPKSGKLPVHESQFSPSIGVEFKETDQTHLAIAVRTFSIMGPRIPVMNVLTTILGHGMSSRLFSKMRDELGICYYVRASHDPFTDHGDLTISAGVDNSRVEEGIRGIMGECNRLKHELVSSAELKKVKDYIAGMTMLELETSDARAEFAGYQEILKKKIELPEDMIAKVNNVTAEDVQKLAQDIFVNTGLNLAVIGKFKDGEEFKTYLKFE